MKPIQGIPELSVFNGAWSLAAAATRKTTESNVASKPAIKKTKKRKAVQLHSPEVTHLLLGGTQFVHGRSRMTIDPRISTMPGRSTSGFHQPGRHCLH